MIDWSAVAQLRGEIGEEDFEAVVDVFLEEVEDKLQELASSPTDAYAAGFHFLKGSASYLGFHALQTVCAEAEKSARYGAYDTIDVDAVSAVYRQSRAHFLAGEARSVS